MVSIAWALPVRSVLQVVSAMYRPVVLIVGLGIAVLSFAPAIAAPIKVYAAGSLKAAVGDILTARGVSSPDRVETTFGSAGTLAQRLGSGERADLFMSADMAAPARLFKAHAAKFAPIAFARNSMCVIGAKSIDLRPETVIDRMLAPDIKLGTSVPGADPSGDYALEVFKRAERSRPGAEQILNAKAIHPFGGPGAITPLEGHTPLGTLFLERKIDLLLSYCSGSAALISEVPELKAVPLDSTLDPGPVYGMTLLSEDPGAAQLALFILSADGQAILQRHGLHPIVREADTSQ
jgi:molybdate transport system substrate-binding protein